ncbi:unnamed protein product [Enterobius vermicularis]|uniref:Acyl-coenzyme A thioesterase 13 n=1 Tax=Enterobius vermicularis TaxID=51028 RepID=A0A0N4V3U0_ENTVE|nr:unnamed protein product [Enterobius vermicularis]
MSSGKYLPLVKELFKALKFKFKAKVLSAEEGRVKVEIDVSEELINPFGFLHGGCTATLVDMVTTAALAATPRGLRGVSVDLNISYLAAAKLGETIVIDASVLRSGKNLAFTRADIFRKSDNALIAVGQHTKAFPAK